MGSSALLLLVSGPAGTGKSTLAEIGAARLGAPVLGWDWVMAGMTSCDEIQDALRGLGRHRYSSVGWSILSNLATAQLRSGRSVVLDGVAGQAEIDRTRQLAADLGARGLVVVTRCSDIGLHRGRIEGRRRDIPGWHELEWSDVAAWLGGWDEPAGADLYLDAADALEDNRDRLVALIDRG